MTVLPIDIVKKAKIEIERSLSKETLELVRIKYLGKKGHFAKQITILRDQSIAKKERAVIGSMINQAKREILQAIIDRKEKLEKIRLDTFLAREAIDISLPGRDTDIGSLHPISHTIACLESCFSKLGFTIVSGLEIEDNYHNFDALNFPSNHPARTSHDTFWFDKNRLLRTHTSGMQIRIMKTQKPPIRIISSGKVYRNDYDQTHTPMFYQMEGLIVDVNINFSNLKGTLCNFLHSFFKKSLQIRFRPSYFPFTMPSAEIDIMKENGRWLEILGCGMIHPSVLHNVGIDSEVYSGFAFGMGIERLTMLRYGVTDLRSFFENNLRFLKLFK
ncbi:phenylalanine--tRNA ligase subunit alpha [Sodalis sp. CWE]|uniref:phenylalanine--tRNA ligase subunit alpha n=1 Tax=Sodalis sp. CWE TaxID=2803816 RepID=UPI001C7CD675|nr:phenylalanine--tRNA ligase subunit alpha [Sodalis sp. CWE]MBX4180905.1 phenylalanine--tRNA ligase subunit alpha [Sodalis sp. CWE]